MGKMNTAMCRFLSSRARFADVFNGILFNGREVIRASGLVVASEQYTVLSAKAPSERLRDIKMYLKTGETLRILALENQNRVDYTLPYRCMQYDALDYERQLEEVKQYNREQKRLVFPAEWLCGITQTDRLAPVYTLCLYHGEEPWDGPLALKDMMDFGEDADGMSRLFNDYPLRLYCVNGHTDFSMFRTEVREVFTALACRRDKKRLSSALEQDAAFARLNADTIKVLSVLLNLPGLWKERAKFMNFTEKDEEEYDMCQAIRELLEDAEKAGLSQGLNQGLHQGINQGLNQGIDLINSLIQKLLADNRLEDLKRSAVDTAFQNRLLAEYQLRD